MNTNRSILIIDDETNLRRSLSVILQRAGYNVTTAGSADEAWQALRSGTFDAALLDIKMPGTSGLELLPQVCQKYPRMAVILITAHATLESAIEAIRRGARDYLLKPINPAQLIGRMEEVLAEGQHNKRQREILDEMRGLIHEFKELETTGAGTTTVQPAVGDELRRLNCGPFRLDLHSRTAQMAGHNLALSPTAFNYLVTLIRHSPHTVGYETLVLESQGYETTPVEAYEMARWRIHELRKALETDSHHPRYIITMRGAGYRLVADPPTP